MFDDHYIESQLKSYLEGHKSTNQICELFSRYKKYEEYAEIKPDIRWMYYLDNNVVVQFKSNMCKCFYRDSKLEGTFEGGFPIPCWVRTEEFNQGDERYGLIKSHLQQKETVGVRFFEVRDSFPYAKSKSRQQSTGASQQPRNDRRNDSRDNSMFSTDRVDPNRHSHSNRMHPALGHPPPPVMDPKVLITNNIEKLHTCVLKSLDRIFSNPQLLGQLEYIIQEYAQQLNLPRELSSATIQFDRATTKIQFQNQGASVSFYGLQKSIPLDNIPAKYLSFYGIQNPNNQKMISRLHRVAYQIDRDGVQLGQCSTEMNIGIYKSLMNQDWHIPENQSLILTLINEYSDKNRQIMDLIVNRRRDIQIIETHEYFITILDQKNVYHYPLPPLSTKNIDPNGFVTEGPKSKFKIKRVKEGIIIGKTHFSGQYTQSEIIRLAKDLNVKGVVELG